MTMQFHGSDTIALDGSETLTTVANFVASAMRGTTSRRNRMMTEEMRRLVSIDDAGNITVKYIEFCDVLGRRSTKNNVLLRKVSHKAAAKKIRNIHSTRRAGLDVEALRGSDDVVLLITPQFKHDDDKVPDFYRDTTSEPNMEQIFASANSIDTIRTRKAA